MTYDKREWQLYEKSILDSVVALCEKYGIKYYLSCGTLLGAVRHKGFIPWDDDIDIDMSINEYKRFCRIPQKEFEEKGIFLQTYHTDPQFNNMWAMVRANNTTSMPVSEKKLDIHWGAHIDVFPIIGLYDNPIMQKIQMKLFDINRMLLEKDYYLSGSIKGYGINSKVALVYKLPRWLLHFTVDLNNIFIDVPFEKTQTGTEKWSVLKPQYKKEFFLTENSIEFEGTMYRAPGDYDGQLTMMYGDYMTPPPERERGGHEDAFGEIIRDLHKDYSEYK